MENVIIEDAGICKKRLKVTIPSPIVDKEVARIIYVMQQKVDIPGFRKGKAPVDMIFHRYKDSIMQELTERLVPESVESISKENNLNLILPISLEKMEMGIDNNFKYEALVEFITKFELKEYKGIKLSKKKIEVKEEEIQDFIKHLQRKAGELVSVENRMPIDTEHVLLDIDAVIEGNPESNYTEKNVEFILSGGELLPELENLIKTMNKGDEKLIDITFPENHEDKKLANKKVTYKIKLNEIKEEKLPNIDDDFAKDVGEFKNLDELKAKITSEITKSKQIEINNELKKQLKDILVSEYQFDLPESLLKEEENHLKQELTRFLGNVNKKIEEFSPKEKNDLEKKVVDGAINNVKASMIFDEIAEREQNDIKVDESEIDKRIEMWSQSEGYEQNKKIDLEKLKQKKEARAYFYSQILTEKVYDFLLNHAKIEEINETDK
ncbi:trigger factor [Candidatus Poribacteria bacterium]|nr:trigger factor [Candidatus Poribacteria bacterium]